MAQLNLRFTIQDPPSHFPDTIFRLPLIESTFVFTFALIQDPLWDYILVILEQLLNQNVVDSTYCLL